MPTILCLETATTMCSVALGKDGKLISFKERNEGFTHSENLTLFIQEVLHEAKIDLRQLDAVAVSKGPGSYTGLRIGVSSAKGLCYALEKPLISIDTLQYLSLALSKGEGTKHIKAAYERLGLPSYFTTEYDIWDSALPKAKENRSHQTKAEKIIWDIVRTNKLGHRFRRQHPIHLYIVDFVCISQKLIIEVDGKYHESQVKEDLERTKDLEFYGFKLIRFTNEEVLNKREEVEAKIKMALVQPSLSFGEGRGEVLFCPMLDARRMEVYCAVYDENGKVIKEVSADIIDENSFSDLLKENEIIFFGDGASKCKNILSKNKNAIFIDDIFPSAKSMIALAEEKFQKKEFEDVAYFEPFYLKDFVGTQKKEH